MDSHVTYLQSIMKAHMSLIRMVWRLCPTLGISGTNGSTILLRSFSKKKKLFYTMNAARRVLKLPPMNPSHVFLGDKSINLVLPKQIPKMYAKMSLVMTSMLGNRNQAKPS